MSSIGNKNLSPDDISSARDEEMENLMGDEGKEEEEEEDFFLRGPSAKKTVRFATEKIKDVHDQIAEVTDVMRDNVGRLMERGDRLDQLNERSEGLAATSDQFRTSSTRLHRKMWWQNMRSNVWLVIIVVVITALIIIPIIIKHNS